MESVGAATADILSRKFGSFARDMGCICHRFVRDAPAADAPAEAKERFFRTFECGGGELARFLAGSAVFGTGCAHQSYTAFRDAYPVSGAHAFIRHVKGADAGNEVHVTAVRHFVERCASAFAVELLRQAKDENLDDFRDIVEMVMNIYRSVEGGVTEFFEMHLYALMKEYSKLFYLLSERRNDIVVDAMNGEIMRFSKFSKIQQKCFYILFGNILIDYEKNVGVLSQITKRLVTYYLRLGKNGVDVMKSSLDFFCNFILQTFPYFNEEKELLSQFLDCVKMQCNTCKHKNKYLKMFAFLSNRISVPLTFGEFFKEFIIPKMGSNELHSSVIDSVVSMLFFNQYSPKYEILTKYTIFEWKSSIPSQEYFPIVLKWLIKYDRFLGKYSSKIGHLFELLMTYDIKLFLNTFAVELLDDIDLNKTYRFGFCRALRTFIANKNRILSLGICKEEDFETMHSLSLKICFTHLHDSDLSPTSCSYAYYTNSFTKSLISAVESKEVALEKMILTIGETSYPKFKHSEKIKDISSSIANWTTEENQEITKQYVFENLEKPVFDRSKSLIYDENKYELLCLIVLLKPNKELIHHICYAILDSPKCGSLAIRILQALIHRYPSCSEQIILEICSIFFNDQITQIFIEILLFALKLIVKAAKYEGIKFSEETVLSLYHVISIGLCSEKFYIRKLVLDLIENNSSEKNRFSKFFHQNIFDISKDAMRRAVKSASQINKQEIAVFPIISFDKVLNSNIPSLYLHYLSSLGKYLTKFFSSENLFNVLHNIFRILCNILMKTSELDEKGNSKNGISYFNNDFEFNAFSLLLSISEEFVIKYNTSISMGYFINKIQTITRKILKQEKFYDSIKLIAMFSGLSSNLCEYVLPFLCVKKESYQRALAFSLNELLADQTCKLSFKIKYTALHSGLMSNISNVLFLDDICSILHHEFRQIFESVEKKTFYMVETTCLESSVLSPYSSEKWFLFLKNLETKKCVKAFSSWLKLFPIPDQYLQEFVQSIPNQSQIYSEIYVVLYGRYYSLLNDLFIHEAGINYSIFYAISSQIKTVDSDIFVNNSNSKERPKILSLIFENCGKLISLCLFYLLSSKMEKRKEALRFLKSIVFIILLYQNKMNDSEKIFKKFDEIKDSIISINTFIKEGFNQLNEILANIFQFCSKQLIYECFNISKMYTNKKIMKKTKSSSIFKINKVNRNSLIIDIILKWIKSFQFNFSTSDIYNNNENSNKQINICSFIDSLLDLCDAQGMTKSIASIFNIIIENNSVHLILLCLYSLQNKSPEHQKSSLLFSLYLYKREPKQLIDEISQYLTLKFWYFNNVLNLQNNNFNIENILSKTSKNKSTESIDFEQVEKSENSVNIEYEKMIIFTMKIIDICRTEDEIKVKPIESMIVIYYFLFNQIYSELSSIPLINNILGVQPMTNTNSTSRILNDVIPFIQGNEKNLLEWGFCCNNLVVASTALTIFKEKGYVLPGKMIDICLRTLHICSFYLNQKTSPSTKKKESDECILKMLIFEQMGQKEDNIEIIVNYILIILELLLIFLEKENMCHQKIFTTAVSFCKCLSVEYQKIYQAGLTIIHFCITKTNFNYSFTGDNDGLISILMNVNVSNYKFIEQVFGIISSLIIKNKISLLHKNYLNYKSILGLILAPYFNTFSANNNLMKISNLLADNPNEENILKQILSQENTDERILIEYTSLIMKKVNEENIKLILNFYSQIFTVSPNTLKESIYFILSEVIKNSKDSNIQNEISSLAYHALYDKENINSKGNSFFLKQLSSIGLSIKEKNTFNVKLPFPLLSIYDGKIKDWEPLNDIDVFEKYEDFPPLCITDNEFSDWDIFNLKSIEQKVKVDKFVKWYSELKQLNSSYLYDGIKSTKT